jgi:hypothetical protein
MVKQRIAIPLVKNALRRFQQEIFGHRMVPAQLPVY